MKEIKMNYTEIVNYIEEIPKFTVKNPPEHTKEMLRRLGNPQNEIKVIHVAGTNGKGSTCAYLASMLSNGGYRTGLFTSPHLVKINDRFRINGEVMADEDFVISFRKVKEIIDQAAVDELAHPSYFETLLLMGLDYYNRKKVDYLVLETGLGGGKDPTNCVQNPLACIITSISIDHVQYLGDTIPAIASEKAGIIKPGGRAIDSLKQVFVICPHGFQCGLDILLLVFAAAQHIKIQQCHDCLGVLSLGISDGGFQGGVKFPVFLLFLVLCHFIVVLALPFVPVAGDGIEILALETLQGLHGIIRSLLLGVQVIRQAAHFFLVFSNGLVVFSHSLVELGVLLRRNLQTEVLADVDDVLHFFILLYRDFLTARRR